MEAIGGVTQASLLDAIRTALSVPQGPDDAVTIMDLARHLTRERGGSIEMMQRRLRMALAEMKTEGAVELVTVIRESLSGRMGRVPAYRLKDLV